MTAVPPALGLPGRPPPHTISDLATGDTIIALASGAGRAGVAVIRVSGPDARTVLSALGGGPAPPARRAVVRALHATGERGSREPGSGDQALLDEAVVILFAAPASFTGEDVLELHVHGGPAIISAVLDAALRTRLVRLAEPGEFTRRAFENGRIDLTRAEAIADLIDAETEGQRRQATRLYQGEAARAFEGWRGQLIAAMAALEASVDFPDEADVGSDIGLAALAPLESLAGELAAALGAAARGEAVREGFRVAILGRPNVGKSSLLNRLARRDAAIVSPVPGTTRDIVDVRLVISGFPVWLADTAGLRETTNPIEAEGVRRARARAEDADLRIWVIDASPTSDPAGRHPDTVSRETSWRPGDLILFNKIDLARPGGLAHEAPEVFGVSASTGEGIDRLEQALARIVEARLVSDEAPLVTRARHRLLVEDAHAHVLRAIEGARLGVGAELMFEDLRLAARFLGRITGSVDVEDLLDRIFSQFCIGK